MSKHLFVAEADKIQDLLFRSSKLRQVAGGSQLLEKFCQKAVSALIDELGGDKKIARGGSFRILFDSKGKAEEFGVYLAEFYRRELGGTITIAEPVKVDNEADAIKQAQVHLRKAKHSGGVSTSIVQMPYLATCAFCGIGIAIDHKSIFREATGNYTCEICDKKAEEIFERTLQFEFRHYLGSKEFEKLDFPKDATKIADLESRAYVAYIVADGNSMGTVFSACKDFDQLEKLSSGLDEVINLSLAEPTKILLSKQRKHLQKSTIPVLPLILGGDDVFVLIPAQWALDFVHRFLDKFEKEIASTLGGIELVPQSKQTISAGVVICKGNFPYLIAREVGEELLAKAKKRAREKGSSTVSFTVITGSDVVKTAKKTKQFVAGFPAYTIEELKKLIKVRYTLRNLPGTVRARLEKLFEEAEGLGDKNELTLEWMPKREFILNRQKDAVRPRIINAFKTLGEPTTADNWVQVGLKLYHQLPDLLRAWDFAYNLEKDISKYVREEE